MEIKEIHINEIMKKQFSNYCEICGNWSNEQCDCCLSCQMILDDCDCEEN